jgi:hypothetical protein
MTTEQLINEFHSINEWATFFFAILLFISGYALGLCHKVGLTKEAEKNKHSNITIIKRGNKKP